ncbi:MAG: SoxR reducing system RseC family protein [Planctomycetota bacterium]
MTKYYTITEDATIVSEDPENNGFFILRIGADIVTEERCATCRKCSKAADGKTLSAKPAENIPKEQLVPGTEVTVEVKLPFLYAHLFCVFVLPMIGFLAGVLLGLSFVGTEGFPALLAVLMGAACGIVFFLAGKILFGRKITETAPPVITAIKENKTR